MVLKIFIFHPAIIRNNIHIMNPFVPLNEGQHSTKCLDERPSDKVNIKDLMHLLKKHAEKHRVEKLRAEKLHAEKLHAEKLRAEKLRAEDEQDEQYSYVKKEWKPVQDSPRTQKAKDAYGKRIRDEKESRRLGWVQAQKHQKYQNLLMIRLQSVQEKERIKQERTKEQERKKLREQLHKEWLVHQEQYERELKEIREANDAYLAKEARKAADRLFPEHVVE